MTVKNPILACIGPTYCRSGNATQKRQYKENWPGYQYRHNAQYPIKMPTLGVGNWALRIKKANVGICSGTRGKKL